MQMVSVVSLKYNLNIDIGNMHQNQWREGPGRSFLNAHKRYEEVLLKNIVSNIQRFSGPRLGYCQYTHKYYKNSRKLEADKWFMLCKNRTNPCFGEFSLANISVILFICQFLLQEYLLQQAIGTQNTTRQTLLYMYLCTSTTSTSSW
jgi:hypothetical protein